MYVHMYVSYNIMCACIMCFAKPMGRARSCKCAFTFLHPLVVKVSSNVIAARSVCIVLIEAMRFSRSRCDLPSITAVSC